MSRAAWIAPVLGFALLGAASAGLPDPIAAEPIGLELRVGIVDASPRGTIEPSYAALVSCLASQGSRTQQVVLDVDGSFRTSGDHAAYAVIDRPGPHEVNCVGWNPGSSARRTRTVYVPYPNEKDA